MGEEPGWAGVPGRPRVELDATAMGRFGQCLREVVFDPLKARKVPLEEIAVRLGAGFSKSTLSRVARGHAPAQRDQVVALLDLVEAVTGVPVGERGTVLELYYEALAVTNGAMHDYYRLSDDYDAQRQQLDGLRILREDLRAQLETAHRIAWTAQGTSLSLSWEMTHLAERLKELRKRADEERTRLLGQLAAVREQAGERASEVGHLREEVATLREQAARASALREELERLAGDRDYLSARLQEAQGRAREAVEQARHERDAHREEELSAAAATERLARLLEEMTASRNRLRTELGRARAQIQQEARRAAELQEEAVRAGRREQETRARIVDLEGRLRQVLARAAMVSLEWGPTPAGALEAPARDAAAAAGPAAPDVTRRQAREPSDRDTTWEDGPPKTSAGEVVPPGGTTQVEARRSMFLPDPAGPDSLRPPSARPGPRHASPGLRRRAGAPARRAARRARLPEARAERRDQLMRVLLRVVAPTLAVAGAFSLPVLIDPDACSSGARAPAADTARVLASSPSPQHPRAGAGQTPPVARAAIILSGLPLLSQTPASPTSTLTAQTSLTPQTSPSPPASPPPAAGGCGKSAGRPAPR
ncbi:hypothetical protein [Kitasatospora herbaricolor]|uniref:hypothetical protein n=1 Tax=Kitasatospora herbaricolor TaxID=68217 RepID=UPI0036DE4173